MGTYKITNVGANKCLNIYGDNVTSLSNNQNVTLWDDSNTNEQKWSITYLGSGVYVRSIINTAFGLNVYRSGSPWNCDVYPISGNETDAKINFIASGSNYKIQLANYPSYYLTVGASGNGANVYWTASNGSSYQLWKCIPLDGTTNGYVYPTSARTMSQSYSASHPAIDIPASVGTPIYAFADGVVAFRQNSSASWSPSDTNPPYSSTSMQTMGNCIAINHTNPNKGVVSGSYARTIYMHMRDNPTLAPGTRVTKGQVIGYVGNTGRSSGAHLHFSLSVGNLSSMAPGSTGWVSLSGLPSVDPRKYLPNYHM